MGCVEVKVKYFVFVIYDILWVHSIGKENGKTHYFGAPVRIVLSRCFTFFAFATHKIIAIRNL